MVELNGCAPKAVRTVTPTAFEIDDTSGLSPYVSHGLVQAVKLPTTLTFQSFEASEPAPEVFMWDFMRFERYGLLHALHLALWAFRDAHAGRDPVFGGDGGDEAAFDRELAAALARVTSCDVDLAAEGAKDARFVVGEFKRQLGTLLVSVCSFLGGYMRRRCSRRCRASSRRRSSTYTGTPLETLPEPVPAGPAPAMDSVPARYQDLAQVFGLEFWASSRRSATLWWALARSGAR